MRGRPQLEVREGFVQLTNLLGQAVWVNTGTVSYFQGLPGRGSELFLLKQETERLFVAERPEEIFLALTFIKARR